MKNLIKNLVKSWVLLYARVDREGDLVGRKDRVYHGYAGDFVSVIIFLAFGNWNNFGGNLHFDSASLWWLFYVLIPLTGAFIVGVGKEMYDKTVKKTKFDWGDVAATVLPFFVVYWLIRLTVSTFSPKILTEIENG